MHEFTVADRLKWVAVTVGVAVVAVPLSFLLWRTPPGVATPPPNLLPLFIPIGVVIPALAFGLGVAFLFFGRSLVNLERAPRWSGAAFAGIAWLLLNWWPHSNFHRVSGSWTNLLLVDYFFHGTAIVATCVVAAFFLKAVRERQATGQVQGDARKLESAAAV